MASGFGIVQARHMWLSLKPDWHLPATHMYTEWPGIHSYEEINDRLFANPGRNDNIQDTQSKAALACPLAAVMSGVISQPTHAVNRYLASCRCGEDSSMSRAEEPHRRLARAESPGLLARNTVDKGTQEVHSASATTLLHTFLPRPG